MTVDEFIALKKRVVTRAKQAMLDYGRCIAEEIYHFNRDGIHVVMMAYNQRFKIQLDECLHYGPGPILVYEERAVDNGHRRLETQLGFSHKELVKVYYETLRQFDRALILEDLANV